jgi:hypothetical protein
MNILNMSTSGSSMTRALQVTPAPRKKASTNSQMLTIMMACLRVIDLAETEKAEALATSLAPMRKSCMKPTRPARTAIHRYSVRATMIYLIGYCYYSLII